MKPVLEKEYKGKKSSNKKKEGYSSAKSRADKKFGKKNSLVKNMWISKQLSKKKK